MYLRKFFDLAPNDGGGGSAETITQAPVNFAEIMAKQGTRMDGDDNSGLTSPIINTEVKEEPKTANDVTPAATATEQPKAESDNPESQTLQVEKAETTETPIAQVEVKPEQTWQEVLRSQQPDNVLKGLGFDDKVVSFVKELKEVDPKMLAFFETWKNNGDVTGYLKELTTDYSKLSAEEVMRHQLRSEYPKASEKALTALYEEEVVDKYNLNSDDDTLLEKGKLLLEAKADRFRDKLIENQQNFLLPKPPEAKAPEVNLQEQKAQQDVEVYKSAIDNSPIFKNLFVTKQVSIGEGEDKFNYPIEPEIIKSLLFDNSKWAETQSDIIKNPDGSVKSATPKIENQILTAAFASNPKKFISELAKHFKALGGKAAIEPIDNAKPPEGTTIVKSEAVITDAAQAMAKYGRLVNS